MVFPRLSESERVARLEPPEGKLRILLDTDTANEIDDQFALAHALLSGEKFDLEAVTAAPFSHKHIPPDVGVEQSMDEILRIFDKLGRSTEGLMHKGADRWLPSAEEPVDTPAAREIVRLGMAEHDRPLYVVAIGAITNVASALIMEPRLVERVVVVWLGGHSFDWPHTREYNLEQDPAAARVVLDCGVPLVLFPCMGVTSFLHTTLPEMEARVKGRGAIGDYLHQIYVEHCGTKPGFSKVLWDIVTFGWLKDPGSVTTALVPSPILTGDITWSFDSSRHLIRLAKVVRRDPILMDLFAKLDALR